MMGAEPPDRIAPADDTTDERVAAGEVVVGSYEALERLKARLDAQATKKERRAKVKRAAKDRSLRRLWPSKKRKRDAAHESRRRNRAR